MGRRPGGRGGERGRCPHRAGGVHIHITFPGRIAACANALDGKPALTGQIPAGSFPRQFALSPDGRTLYVTNFNNAQLETVNVADLVKAAAAR